MGFLSLSSSNPDWPSPIAEAAFIGPIGQAARIIEPHTEADTAAIMIPLIVAAGNLIGRNIHFRIGSTLHYPVLYTAIVGDTASGKGGGTDAAIALLGGVDPEWRSKRISSGLSSGEGMISTVADQAATDKRLMVIEPELASVFKQMHRPGNILSPVLRQAWDNGDIRTLTKKPLVATGTHICTVGHITPDELKIVVPSAELANGLANRFLWTCVKRARFLPSGGDIDGESACIDIVVATMRDSLAWLHHQQQPFEIHRDTDAGSVWNTVYPELTRVRPTRVGKISARAAPNVMRMALIFAVFDQSKVIRRTHLDAALAVWAYCESSVNYLFGKLWSNDKALRANISETFLTAQNREQGEKEMNHDRRSEAGFGGDGIRGPGSNAEGEATQLQRAL